MSQSLTVRIAFLDVGQGDTMVVSIPETHEAVIVDCVDPAAVLSYLKDQKIRYLRGVIVTHLHLDHYKGVVSLVNNCGPQLHLSCERIVFNWPTNAKMLDGLFRDGDNHSDVYADNGSNKKARENAFREFKKWMNTQSPTFGDGLMAGKAPIPGNMAAVIDVLQPYHKQMGELLSLSLNNTSGVLKVKGASSCALLTGDIEPAGWTELESATSDLTSDVLKYPHHGVWRDASVTCMLDRVQPSIVVISVGTDGARYGHPDPGVLSAIAERKGTRLLCTEATPLCMPDVRKKRDSVIRELQLHCAYEGERSGASASGCPCAGTVIVELASRASVVHPGVEFHQNRIIKPHFPDHKCAVQTTSIPIG